MMFTENGQYCVSEKYFPQDSARAIYTLPAVRMVVQHPYKIWHRYKHLMRYGATTSASAMLDEYWKQCDAAKTPIDCAAWLYAISVIMEMVENGTSDDPDWCLYVTSVLKSYRAFSDKYYQFNQQSEYNAEIEARKSLLVDNDAVIRAMAVVLEGVSPESFICVSALRMNERIVAGV